MSMSIRNWVSATAKEALRAIHGAGDFELRPADARDEDLIAQLRRRAAEIERQLADQDAAEEWVRHQLRLAQLIAAEDPRNFLRWDVIRATMFVGDSWGVRKELQQLRKSAAWDQRWRQAIEESGHGRPNQFFAYPRSSGNLIHHAFHLHALENALGVLPGDFDAVCELGGGYGSMYRLFHRLGFAGRYQIIDLPIFSALQRFYVDWLGLPCQPPKLELQSDLAAAVRWRPEGRSLFIATWSMSESPMSVRQQLVPYLDQFTHLFIAYQTTYEQYRNHDYFGKLVKDLSSRYTCLQHEIPRLGSYYLFAKRR